MSADRKKTGSKKVVIERLISGSSTSSRRGDTYFGSLFRVCARLRDNIRLIKSRFFVERSLDGIEGAATEVIPDERKANGTVVAETEAKESGADVSGAY